MASASQLKALFRSHLEGDDQRFFSIALQVAAHEARLGHGKLAEELRDIIDEAKKHRSQNQTVPISRPRGELAGLLTASYPKTRLSEMILSPELDHQIHRVIREQRHASRILENGLTPRRKLLLVGPPGTGKTLTAFALAGELGIPLFQVRLDGLLTKFMGEAAAKLRQIFDATNHTRGVYFFDEFDAIGSQRGMPNDVGEIRRVLNSFLQMIEQDYSHSLIVAATNHSEILDPALFRRFDDVLHYEIPEADQILKLLKQRLLAFSAPRIGWKRLSAAGAGLSFAEISRAADEVLKHALINEQGKITESEILPMLEERQEIARKLLRKN